MASRTEAKEAASQTVVDDKAKSLLNLVIVLLPILTGIATVLPRGIALGTLVPAGPLVCAGLLLLWYFGINRRMVPTLSQELVQAKDDEAALREMLVSIDSATRHNSAITDFHVDVYRAACRLVGVAICAMLGIALVAATLHVFRPPEDLITRLRGEPDLVELLRGPRGPSGQQGQPGRQGPSGERGERGPTGPPGPVGQCTCPPESSERTDEGLSVPPEPDPIPWTPNKM